MYCKFDLPYSVAPFDKPGISMIVTVTLNPALDRSFSVERVVPENKLSCGPPSFDAGGGGLNVARVIHELGGEAMAFWTCGGIVGQLLRETLDQVGVRHQPVCIEEMTRENVIVFEESSGQQYRFGMPGAAMSEQELEACLSEIKQLDPSPQFLVLSGSLPPGLEDHTYARIARAAPDGCRVIVDTREQPLKCSLEASLFLIKPNLRELGILAGREVTEDAEIEEACERLIDQGNVEVIVVSIGSGGVMLFTRDHHEKIRAPTVKIRSKVGAGDSTVGGIVTGLSQGLTINDAVRFGVAAGSAAVMTEGTQLCRREDVERLFRDMMK